MASRRVLLVEDEFLVRFAVAEALRGAGFEVIEAQDSDEAVALIDGLDGFDLLLTDVQMPGSTDGIAVASHARQRHPDVPVIVVSAWPVNAQRLGGPASRSVFVAKPYDLDALVRTMRRLLETKE